MVWLKTEDSVKLRMYKKGLKEKLSIFLSPFLKLYTYYLILSRILPFSLKTILSFLNKRVRDGSECSTSNVSLSLTSLQVNDTPTLLTLFDLDSYGGQGSPHICFFNCWPGYLPSWVPLFLLVCSCYLSLLPFLVAQAHPGISETCLLLIIPPVISYSYFYLTNSFKEQGLHNKSW